MQNKFPGESESEIKNNLRLNIAQNIIGSIRFFCPSHKINSLNRPFHTVIIHSATNEPNARVHASG